MAFILSCLLAYDLIRLGIGSHFTFVLLGLIIGVLVYDWFGEEYR